MESAGEAPASASAARTREWNAAANNAVASTTNETRRSGRSGPMVLPHEGWVSRRRVGRSPDSRVILERRLPGFPQWLQAALVTAHSGGAVSDSHRLPGPPLGGPPTLAAGSIRGATDHSRVRADCKRRAVRARPMRHYRR